MESIDQRLAQADPVPSGSYRPEGYAAMVSRVVRTGPPRRDPTWSRLRLRVGAALAATTALTSVGVAALSSVGGALPVLALAAQHGAKVMDSQAISGAFAATAAPTPTTYYFTGLASLSAAGSAATTYDLRAPSDPVAALAAVAQGLGVSLPTGTTSDGGASFTAAGPTYSGWLTTTSGYDNWGVDQGGVVASSTPPSSVASTALQTQEGAIALSMASAISPLSFGSAQLAPDGNGGTTVTLPVLVGGLATDFSDSFTFGADGSLQSASGVLFTLTSAGDYPLISPVEGVGEINAQLALTTSFVTGGVYATARPSGPVSTTSAPAADAAPGSTTSGAGSTTTTAPGQSGTSAGVSSGSLGSSAPTTTLTPTTTLAPTTTTTAPTTVRLSGEVEQYALFEMSHGVTMMLPVYVYTGTVEGADGGYQVSFRVVPIEPQYLDLSGVTGIR